MALEQHRGALVPVVPQVVDPLLLPRERVLEPSRPRPLVSSDYDAAGGGVRGVGLEPMGRATALSSTGSLSVLLYL